MSDLGEEGWGRRVNVPNPQGAARGLSGKSWRLTKPSGRLRCAYLAICPNTSRMASITT